MQKRRDSCVSNEVTSFFALSHRYQQRHLSYCSGPLPVGSLSCEHYLSGRGQTRQRSLLLRRKLALSQWALSRQRKSRETAEKATGSKTTQWIQKFLCMTLINLLPDRASFEPPRLHMITSMLSSNLKDRFAIVLWDYFGYYLKFYNKLMPMIGQDGAISYGTRLINRWIQFQTLLFQGQGR